MHQYKYDISVVIVNYKVKEYIANLLNSLNKAKQHLSLQIFVVDNASGDDAVTYLRSRFPTINYIENTDNLGFGKANNQAIRQADGKYTLIINPDTLVSEDTLTVLYNHMENNESCGAAGCKILNPDGSFAPESRRSVPTIWSATCKVFGLNQLFSKNKLFGQYYLSWLNEDSPSQVPVLSGSFMFWRTTLLKDLDGFDERFFMYGEDIDLCYRVQATPFHIDYIPFTSIIHYKGESTKRKDLRYVRIFNKALYQFFDKHFSSRYSLFFRFLIYMAIWFQAILSFVGNIIQSSKTVFVDLLVLNLSISLGFFTRYMLQGVNIISLEGIKYLWINVLASVIYLLSGSIMDIYREKLHSLSSTIKVLALTYIGVVVVTFFVRDLAYTRLGLIIGFLYGVILFTAFRLYKINTSESNEHNRGKIRNSRIVIVGDAEYSEDIISKIHSRPDWTYEVVGFVQVQNENITEKSLGSLAQLQDLVKAYKADQVFFALQSISYKQMLKEISNLQKEEVIFKLIPDSMDFILGKSKVEYLESIPLVEVEFAYTKPINLFLKRSLDIILAAPVFLGILILTFPSVLFRKHEFFNVGRFKFYANATSHTWKNRMRLLGYILSGELSLVGSPIIQDIKSSSSTVKEGISGIVQINQNKIQNPDDAESFELYYLQNYSVWMDIDILIKTLFNGPRVIDELAGYEEKFKKNRI